MNIRSTRTSLATLIFSLVFSATASAQSLDSLKETSKGLFSGGSGASQTTSGGSLLGSLGAGSFDLGSMQNVAGILGYCQKQGYTGSATDRIKDKLLGQIGGQDKAAENSAYQQGLGGILQGESGQSFNLESVKNQVGKKVCNSVADRAVSSFL